MPPGSAVILSHDFYVDVIRPGLLSYMSGLDSIGPCMSEIQNLVFWRHVIKLWRHATVTPCDKKLIFVFIQDKMVSPYWGKKCACMSFFCMFVCVCVCVCLNFCIFLCVCVTSQTTLHINYTWHWCNFWHWPPGETQTCRICEDKVKNYWDVIFGINHVLYVFLIEKAIRLLKAALVVETSPW